MEKMERAGIVLKMPEAEYHSGDEVSKSALDIVDRSLAHYEAKLNGEFDIEQTAAMLRGSVAHCLILEPHTFADKYSVEPVIADTALAGAEAMKNLISQHNESIDPPISTDKIKQLISDHNLSIEQPYPLTGSADEVFEHYMSLPESWQTVGDQPKANDYKNAIKAYNASLPKPLKTSGSRETLISTLAEFNPELAEVERKKSGPLPLSGTLADLAERIRTFDPDAEFEHEIIAKWKSSTAEKTLVSRSLYEQCKSIAAAVHAHEMAGLLLSNGQPEVSIFWEDPETYLACRGRADWYNDGALLDVKIVGDSSAPNAFARKAANMRYHVQAAFYTDGFNQAIDDTENYDYHKIEGFYFIAVEAEYPHLVTVCKFDDDAMEVGRRAYRKNLDDLADAFESDNWRGYSDKVEVISLPGYANKYLNTEDV